MAGVGTTPALVTVAPSPDAPCASSASSHAPDSRVSRPISIRTGRSPPCPALAKAERTSAAPRRRAVGGSSGYRPAVPRTPSVPKSRGTSWLTPAGPLFISISATVDSHLHRLRFDAYDACVTEHVDVNRERVFTGAET